MRVLDTDIATLLYYGRNDAVNRAYNNARQIDAIHITLVSWVELLRGRLEAVRKAADGVEWLESQKRLDGTRDWLDGFEIVPITTQAANHYDRLRKDKKMRSFGHADLLIACIALAHNATLVTRNVKDFAKVPSLKIENWAK